MPNIHKSELIDPLKEALGKEKSESLFREAIVALNLPLLDFYSPEECLTIIEQFKRQGGLIKILAMNLSVRMVLKGTLPPM